MAQSKRKVARNANKERLMNANVTNENENHWQMRIGLSNYLEPVQTRKTYMLGISTNSESVRNKTQPKTGVSTMNANECKTCKHYRPGHALDPRGDCTLYPTWLDVPAAHYCGQWAGVTAKAEAPKSVLDIDWDLVPEGYDWVTQDSNGDIYARQHRPTLIIEAESGRWRWRGDKYTQFFIDCRPWSQTNKETSICKRPGT